MLGGPFGPPQLLKIFSQHILFQMITKIQKSLPLLLTLCFALLLALPASAQSHKKKAKKKPKKDDTEVLELGEKAPEGPAKFADKLWYGGGFVLGFGSNVNASIFQIGVSPMVGYKLTKGLSVGPRLAFAYTNYKEAGSESLGLLEFEPGVFARYRLGPVFLHGELSDVIRNYTDLNNGFFTAATGSSRFNQYLGLGYNSGDGYGWGTELAVLYNFAANTSAESLESPFNLRFGLTYKF